MSVLNQKKIILGVCGGVAAYKSAELLRLLIKQGAQVQVVMTASAQKFIGSITFQALSTKEVRSSLFDLSAEAGMGHIELAQWADLILIAPATASTIAKITYGMADNLLTTLCLASKAPLLIAPAMNQQMWLNEATKNNINILSQRDRLSICGPAIGEQACGDNGPGRMEEPEVLLSACQKIFNNQAEHTPLYNKRILITAGPTIEDIDPVRYLSNRSSGKMGYAIAQAAQKQGAKVTLISGPVALNALSGVHLVNVRSAQEMHDAVFEEVAHADIFIATAAVADYRPIKLAQKKIKKNTDTLIIELQKNPDILSDVAKLRNKPLCVGFAAETHNLENYARNKLKNKNLDIIIANKVGVSQGFEVDNNELHLFWKAQLWHTKGHKKEILQGQKKLPFASKKQLASQLLNEVALLYFN
jgi:phosphopantothenoylcysteine decarboxylase/phosphopantothenate--cysteine ligase